MRTVSKEEFYAIMGPRNVHPHPEKQRIVWKQCVSGQVVGIETPGYLLEGAESYQTNLQSEGRPA